MTTKQLPQSVHLHQLKISISKLYMYDITFDIPRCLAQLISPASLLSWRRFISHLPKTKHKNISNGELKLSTCIPVWWNDHCINWLGPLCNSF